ncbi:MAG TPA: hypothetical protein VKX17_17185 [Planctomycetota bacterium]|nr:hypothetical protein [Planctomycetota bacterium]
MNGLVYTLDDSDSTPLYWLGIVLAAMAVTLLPLFTLSLPKVPDVGDEPEIITISLDTSLLDLPPDTEKPPEEKAASKEIVIVKQLAPKPPDPVKTFEKQPEPAPPKPEPAAAVVQLPPEILQPKPEVKGKPAVETPPPPPAKAEEPKVAKPARALHDRDVNGMLQNDTAFDESSKVTKDPPKNGYLSDRNSTAADRGPKNLPQGDPFMERGQTNIVRYSGTRGEGNLPALDSDVNSGSVKKEGLPVQGDGGGARAKDFAKSVQTAPPAPDKNRDSKGAAEPAIPKIEAAKIEAQPKAGVLDTSKDHLVDADKAVKPSARPLPKDTAEEVSEIGTKLAAPDKKIQPAEPLKVPMTLEVASEKEKPKLAVEAPKPPFTDAARAHATVPPPRPPTFDESAIAKAFEKDAELAAFEAQLNGPSNPAAGDGSPGKTGPKLREGQTGHEGNGTLRPGDEGAVSDVTTVNLSSSATEIGDPRFEKRFDAKTAYIKAFSRRVDAKWKADIHAYLRNRLVPGAVEIRVVLRKDGKLMEASEARRDRGMPDEYVASAKRAAQEAADPKADPFPPALSGRETIEYTFVFVYQ